MSWTDDIPAGGFLSVKEGQQIQMTNISSIRKNTNSKYNYKKKKDDEDLGYATEFICDEGTLNVSTFSLIFAFRDAGIEIGMSCIVTHPSHGKYTVTRIMDINEAVTCEGEVQV